MSAKKDSAGKSHSLQEFDKAVTSPGVYDAPKVQERKEKRGQAWGCLMLVFYTALFIGFIVMMLAG